MSDPNVRWLVVTGVEQVPTLQRYLYATAQLITTEDAGEGQPYRRLVRALVLVTTLRSDVQFLAEYQSARLDSSGNMHGYVFANYADAVDALTATTNA